ncbi:pentatricopeptide repeat-containing protein At3g16610-like [Chenopodium quinoa]|uniref:pentatricopeptide repeat-containing protein At3g16610-like n=1 Tax=Chenopodium quinoa TaxID=63459 RepID=UPI000B76FDF2|nr:pentatricopeptide repeat-containing protein At3g16610-like [Chenopodium quinoa]
MVQCLARLNRVGRPFFTTTTRFLHAITVDKYPELLEHCIQTKSLKHGKIIHQHFLKNYNYHVNGSSVVIEKLTRFYLICGRLSIARHVFDEIPEPTVVLWNLMIRAYSWNGPFDASIDLYSQMIVSGILPNNYTFPFVLKACSGLNAIERGEEIHSHVLRLGFDSDVYVSTALVDLYAKCGELARAENVFYGMSCRDIVAWNAMIAGFSVYGFYDDMIRLVVDMQEAGISPNSSTVVTILPAVAQACSSSHGKEIHGYSVRRGFTNAVMVGTGLVDMYGKCGCISYARITFDLLSLRNEVTWSAMIGGYVASDQMREALKLFNHMLLKEAGSPSLVTLCCAVRACTKLIDLANGRRIHGYILKSGYLSDLMVSNTTLSMYAKCGILDDAVKFFQEMNPIDRVSYGAMISGSVQNGSSLQGLKFFRNMQSSGIDPDEATMLALLPACSHLSALKYGACSHGYSVIRGFVSDTSICNALIDMYAKCGKIRTAREVFNRMHKRDIISWNSMIAGYGIHGLGSDALALFSELRTEGLMPDDITFISLLIACTHAGLVTEGKYWFDAMVRKFQIAPKVDHCICMVDLLGRAGLLEEAKNFIDKMPCTPNVHVWSALLAACKIYKDVELAEEAAKRIHSLGSESSGNFVLLSNIYSCAGRWEEAASVRITQSDQGFKKRPGCSWVEINGKIHAFIGGDNSHPQSEQIYKKLEELLTEIKKFGYQAVPSVVFQDVEEEEKEHILLYHSEKLAIAYATISLSPSQPIFVTKNLRVCGDCHEAIKHITLVTKREITIRDTSRFHHFRDGVCSCGDYW